MQLNEHFFSCLMIQALSEPSERVSLGFQIVFGLASASAFLALMPVLTILNPGPGRAGRCRADCRKPGDRSAGWGGGGINRQSVGWRAQRPHNLPIWPPAALDFGGSLATAAGLALLANSYSVLWLAIGWFLVQFFGNMLISAYSAIMPDRVPVQQRGTTQAILGLISPILAMAGAYYLGQVQDFRAGYYPIIVVLILLNALYSWASTVNQLCREGRCPAWI